MELLTVLGCALKLDIFIFCNDLRSLLQISLSLEAVELPTSDDRRILTAPLFFGLATVV